MDSIKKKGGDFKIINNYYILYSLIRLCTHMLVEWNPY